jgi:uncharacterized protein YndB with AHSA1/START domain
MTTPPDHPMGTIERTDAGWRLRFERRLAHAPDRVWRALTESEHLRHWMPVDIVGERRVGASIELPFWPEVAAKHALVAKTLPGEILVWDPPSVFQWRWDTEVLRFELVSTGDGGTLLTLVTVVGDEPPAWSAAAGYHACLGQLGALLDDGRVGSLMDLDMAPLEARYRAVVEG